MIYLFALMAGTENFNEESQGIIKQWKKIVKQKHKKDKNNEDVDTYYEAHSY